MEYPTCTEYWYGGHTMSEAVEALQLLKAAYQWRKLCELLNLDPEATAEGVATEMRRLREAVTHE